MKPRTKKEQEVAALSKLLSPIGKDVIDYGGKKLSSNLAFLCKKEAWCSECGVSWMQENKVEEVRCPHCGKLLKVEKSPRKKYHVGCYVTLCRAFRGYQVLRHVLCLKATFKYNTTAYFESYEVSQQWFDEAGNDTIIALPRNYSGNWIYGEDLSIKNKRLFSNYYNVYDIDGYVYPKATFIPILKKYGLKSSVHGLYASWLIRSLLKHAPLVEMLLKTKQYALLDYKMHRGGIAWFEKTINICNRHKYIVEDGEMYADYLYLLREFNLDLHNPFYVCPKNLKKAHDSLVKRKKKKEAILRKKREWEEAIKRKEMIKSGMRNYCSHIMHYMHLSIKDKGLTIRPLMNVTEFYVEAKHLHHCLWVRHYYDHADCLILTARKGDEILETIEINTSTYQIVQCHGDWNHNSKYHDDIIQIIKNNMKYIKKCA